MDTAATFRMCAADYRRLAEVTVDPGDRRFRFQMADHFERAANEAEMRLPRAEGPPA
jgi:hypothetical protein